MLKLKADAFVKAILIAQELYRGSVSVEVGQCFDSESLAQVLSNLIELEIHLSDLDMPVSLAASQEIRKLLEYNNQPAVVRWNTRHLMESMDDELRTVSLFVVPTSRKHYYNEGQLFGLRVASEFPSAIFDIAEAGKCIALGRFTAAVFHLMRALEIGLCIMAKELGVPSDHTNWHNIIEGIERSVRCMASDPSRPTDWKDQQEFFSKAASHFMFLKDGWRNYAVHRRSRFTDEEAEMIFINARGFMQTLAMRLHE
ncbi:MAG: hypothetical protein ABI165_19155 [Bryobacteraceae bacterium]